MPKKKPEQPGKADLKNPLNVPEPFFAEDARNTPDTADFQPSDDPNSGLHEGESEKQAIQRVFRRVWGEMIPQRNKYNPHFTEIRDAFQGIVREAKDPTKSQRIFPIVFMMVDTKMGIVMTHRPRATFQHDIEHKKMKFIENAYDTVSEDVGDGINLETIDYLWELYSVLYGWSIKRVWSELDQHTHYVPVVAKDDSGNVAFANDGMVKIEYHRVMERETKVKHRVYEPDMVAVDPSPFVMFLAQAMDIVFFSDIHFDQFSQKYRDNPLYKNTRMVKPGQYYNPFPQELTVGNDVNGQASLYATASSGIQLNRVRIEEYYNRARNEYMMRANNIPILHIPNPTPGNMLPAADLHDRIMPATFYSKGEGAIAEPIIAIYQKLMNARAARAQLSAAPVVMTDSPSGMSPKSFKVYPGAHWRGMKGRVEVLDLGGADRGEVSEYMEELRNLWKTVLGIDTDRLVSPPDPTAFQQAARDAASQVRVEKDTTLNENNGHVRAMNLTVMNIQTWLTIPDLAKLADLDDEAKAEIKEWDIVKNGKEEYYRKFPMIKTKGVRYEEKFSDGKFDLVPAQKDIDGYGRLPARPEYLQTKTPITVRAVSNRTQVLNRQEKLERAQSLLANAFALPPKNQDEIAKAQQQAQQPQPGQPPPQIPDPEYYINRAKAVDRYLEGIGEDIDEMTAQEDDMKDKPAQAMLQQFLKQMKPLRPTSALASPPDLSEPFLKAFQKNKKENLASSTKYVK